MSPVPGITGKGWEQQPPDERDRIYKPPADLQAKLSANLQDTHHLQKDPFDQLDLQSCVANALSAALQYAKKPEVWGPRAAPYLPSRLFICYHAHILAVTGGIAPSAEDVAKALVDNTSQSITLVVDSDTNKTRTISRD